MNYIDNHVSFQGLLSSEIKEFYIMRITEKIICILVCFLIACSNPTKDTKDRNEPKEDNIVKSPNEIIDVIDPPVEKLNLPAFKVESQELHPLSIKASFDLRLEKRISEDEIELIANIIKSKHPGFERYFILYWLPDMKIGTGAWATSHFNPSLEINILGLLEEEAKTMKEATLGSALPEGEVIGKWFDSDVIGMTMIIYKSNGVLKLREIFKDGSFGDKGLIKKGNNYIYENFNGEYLRIENDGNLGWYNDNGKFGTAKKIK